MHVCALVYVCSWLCLRAGTCGVEILHRIYLIKYFKGYCVSCTVFLLEEKENACFQFWRGAIAQLVRESSYLGNTDIRDLEVDKFKSR